MINETKTFELFGYTSDSLSKGSNKKIVRICDDCGKIDIITMKSSSRSKWSVCQSCAHSGIKSSLYKSKITLICQQCNKKFKTKLSGKNRKFCSKKCHNEWMHINQSGKNSYEWEGGLSNIKCIFCNKEFSIKPYRIKLYNFCSQKCYGKWVSENLIGEKSHHWKGGFDTTRSHLIHVTHCIQLNSRFPGSEGHHIMSGVVIFMPKNMHKSISHNFKSGKNMNIINKIAWNYLMGDY